MFARVLDTARRILSRSPSVQDLREEAHESTPTPEIDADMVTTTRRGPVEGRTPRSSATKIKGKRALEPEDTPVNSKKRRKSQEVDEPVNEELNGALEEATVGYSKSPPVMEPLETSNNSEKKNKLPIRGHHSPQVVINQLSRAPEVVETSTETLEASPAHPIQENSPVTPLVDKINTVIVTPLNEQLEKEEGSPTPEATSARKGRTPGLGKKGSGTIPSDDLTSTKASSGEQIKSHFRFGSEEPVETEAVITYLPAQEQHPDIAEEDGDESDSDEAPEQVTVVSARSKAKAIEAEAARAFRAQQEREARFKRERTERIAQEKEQKRRKLEKKASEYAKLEAKRNPRTREELYDAGISNIPALLPDKLLEAAGDRRPPTPPTMVAEEDNEELRRRKLNHHIKFTERAVKPAPDVKKGSFNVHVLKDQSSSLAPAANGQSKQVRESWLRGRQRNKNISKGRRKGTIGKMERRAVGGGFIRDEN
ncbi:U3 snoRNA associated-domain-containing protein [Dendryphion nanum]|uniref:U3 snoRNA associated-domain-containing protein n=1 Tax=Dendryphion nanum TaxID=256645 RepID=A0A9P9IEI5_9PLEO|nr:U3 snoRNA associated-domain-containing protein [Dendryphion nanum]